MARLAEAADEACIARLEVHDLQALAVRGERRCGSLDGRGGVAGANVEHQRSATVPVRLVSSQRKEVVEQRGWQNAHAARFNHASDDVQQQFYDALGGDPADFPARLRAVERRLKRLPNYRSYLACGDGHCALPTSEFSSLRVDGVPLRDWLADLAAGKDVSCPMCE